MVFCHQMPRVRGNRVLKLNFKCCRLGLPSVQKDIWTVSAGGGQSVASTHVASTHVHIVLYRFVKSSTGVAPIDEPMSGSVVIEREMTSGARNFSTVFRPMCPTIPGTTAMYLHGLYGFKV